ncbi:MAG: ABC transporter substrate-binding protein [Bdellovibrionales bacterium]|nr:ABC transporter substrate-binding protein [Bdellovibrionales bacterium]
MASSILRVFCIAALLLTSHCKWHQPPPADTLVVGLASLPKTLDPRYATDANGQRIGSLIFSSLVKSGPNLEPIADAAESWSYDQRVYTFQLRPGLAFHNGDPLTKDDILYSFSEYQKPSSPFAPILSVIDRVEAEYGEGKYFVRLYLKEFAAPFLKDLSVVKLLSKKITEAAGKDFYKAPIGTGVFRFSKQEPNNIYLTRYENYFGSKSQSKNILFKIIKDSNTRFQKVYKGQIDIVQGDIPYSKVKVFKRSDQFDVIIEPGLSTTYLLFNLKDPIFKDVKVRRAIHSAIHRRDIIKYSLEELADPATSIISPVSPFFDHNLRSENMTSTEISEVFSKLRSAKVVLKTSNQMEAIEHGKIIAHQLRKAGLSLEQQSYEWGTYYEDVRTGKFQMAIMKWVGVQDPDIYRISLHSKMTPPGRNRGYYSNPQFDQLVEAAYRESNFEKRKKLYKKIQEIAYKDLPTDPLWYEKQVAIVHKRVKNYSLPVSGDFRSLATAYKEDDGK